MDTRDLYVEELETEFEGIKDFDLESEDHKRIVGDITQLTDRYVKLKEVDIKAQELELEREKVETDKQKIEIEMRKADIETKKLEFEREKMKEDKSDRWIRYVIDGLGIIVPAGITVTGMVLMFLFEEKGTITSRAGSKIVDRMFRTK